MPSGGASNGTVGGGKPDDPMLMTLVKQPGVTCWRIEKLALVRVADTEWGVFYEGDSYIVICTKESKSRQLSFNIHFWLGRNTSVDESTVAAYKTVEIDDALNGVAVQYREVQQNESDLFVSYFTSGIFYKPGGIATALNHVQDESKPKLLHLKGKRRVRVSEVPMKWESFNSGDSFIADLGSDIYVWNGRACNKMERIQAMKTANLMRDHEKAGNCKIHVVEETDFCPKELERIMGTRPAQLNPPIQVTPDDLYEEEEDKKKMKLFLVSDNSGSLLLTEVGCTLLKQKLLSSKDCFILDTCSGVIYVWKGKFSSPQEKKGAMKNALAFIKTKKYANETRVVAVVDGAECTEFKLHFHDWKDKYAQAGLGSTHARGSVAKINDQQKFDAESLLAKPEVAVETRMVDDGTGDVKIWEVEKKDIRLVDAELHGQLFADDCFIVQYSYNSGGSQKYILYYWLGSRSSQEAKGICALKTIEIDDSLGGAAVQVRIVEGKEPNHFLCIFKGKLIIHRGNKKGGGLKQLDSTKTANLTRNHLYRVTGDNAMNTKAVEVECTASNLNSNDAFILKTKKALYIWFGKLCNGDEREMTRVASRIISGRDYELIVEGKEPHEFWINLGGKATYTKSREDQSFAVEPRLFQCSNASGTFRAEEIVGFIQEDLCETDVMILDGWFDIFVWIGNGANVEERKKAPQLALDYLRKDSGRRDPNTPIYSFQQGHEPLMFTGFFVGWNPSRFLTSEKYVQMKGQMKGLSSDQIESEIQVLNSSRAENRDHEVIYTYEELKSGRPLPYDVDPSSKEMLLAEEEFKIVFGMGKSEFTKKPKWKQVDLKKKAHLF